MLFIYKHVNKTIKFGVMVTYTPKQSLNLIFEVYRHKIMLSYEFHKEGCCK